MLHTSTENEHSPDGSSPSGWPLCLGQSGIVIHLGPLNPSVVRNRDCYLCVRSRSAPGLEVALIWRKLQQIHCHTIAEFRNPLYSLDDIMCSSLRSASDLEITSYDDYDGAELPELLQNLLVSVEHAIKRVPLDDLTFPCPQCLQYLPLDRQEDDISGCSCQCSCRLSDGPVTKKDSSIQTSPMFEFVGSIPHIDSDEDDDKESTKSVIQSTLNEFNEGAFTILMGKEFCMSNTIGQEMLSTPSMEQFLSQFKPVAWEAGVRI
ncbi:hypothetical protein NQ317_014601 [Molorchus minor]|uniref:Uncharacterized protein n=1 Tax=Molorchus minor TaxID=1323400 RepID=A0ABQ9IYU2_9CUCU|nr:hypothetical protein NQ317_014601 [Molorchus minor]